MRVGKPIQMLLAWAAEHSPRSKQLYRYVMDLHEAIAAELERTKGILSIAAQMQSDRDALGVIAHKMAMIITDTYGCESPGMTNKEFQLYTSALLNHSLMQFFSKPINDDLIFEIKAVADNCFREVLDLGCPQPVLDEMKAHFHSTLKVQPPEDAALTANAEVVTVDDGGE